MAGKYVRLVTAMMENIHKHIIIIYFIISEKNTIADISYAMWMLRASLYRGRGDRGPVQVVTDRVTMISFVG